MPVDVSADKNVTVVSHKSEQLVTKRFFEMAILNGVVVIFCRGQNAAMAILIA
jgi:hypothetical protein